MADNKSRRPKHRHQAACYKVKPLAPSEIFIEVATGKALVQDIFYAVAATHKSLDDAAASTLALASVGALLDDEMLTPALR